MSSNPNLMALNNPFRVDIEIVNSKLNYLTFGQTVITSNGIIQLLKKNLGF